MQKLTSSEIHNLLTTRREIAIVWCIADVKAVRPDLSEDQCWEVLQEVWRKHDANHGVTWQTIEDAADRLYGAPERAGDENRE
jgi:hypothetical protein